MTFGGKIIMMVNMGQSSRTTLHVSVAQNMMKCILKITKKKRFGRSIYILQIRLVSYGKIWIKEPEYESCFNDLTEMRLSYTFKLLHTKWATLHNSQVCLSSNVDNFGESTS